MIRSPRVRLTRYIRIVTARRRLKLKTFDFTYILTKGHRCQDEATAADCTKAKPASQERKVRAMTEPVTDLRRPVVSQLRLGGHARNALDCTTLSPISQPRQPHSYPLDRSGFPSNVRIANRIRVTPIVFQHECSASCGRGLRTARI